MSCTCKKESKQDNISNELPKIEFKNNIIFRFILFLISIIIIPILYPVMIVIMFKHFMIGGDIDILKLVKKFKKKEIEEESIDIETLNPEDYEIIGVDELVKEKNE